MTHHQQWLVGLTPQRMVAGFVIACTSGCGKESTAIAAPCLEKSLPATQSVVIHWNTIARGLVSKYLPTAAAATRVYALLSVAQAAALEVVDSTRQAHPGQCSGTLLPASDGASAAAAFGVLSTLYPAELAALTDSLTAETARAVAAGESASELTTGKTVGTSIAARVMARATSDHSSDTWTGTVPTGPGLWIFPGSIATPQWPKVTPWLMTSGNQFLPAPPPAVDTPDYTRALNEVRNFSDTRTPAQLALSQFWNDPAGAGHHSGHWNALASAAIVAQSTSELRMARTLALVNVAIADAAIACFQAKYTYWLIRPYQADHAITTPIGQPPHPSYPSLHMCETGAAVGVLNTLVPNGNAWNTMESDIAMSRIYAGLHYRFDNETGARMGHQVAALAIGAEGRGVPIRSWVP